MQTPDHVMGSVSENMGLKLILQLPESFLNDSFFCFINLAEADQIMFLENI